MKRYSKIIKTSQRSKINYGSLGDQTSLRSNTPSSKLDFIFGYLSNQQSDLGKMNEVKSVRKKTSKEVRFLEKMFDNDPSWSRTTVKI